MHDALVLGKIGHRVLRSMNIVIKTNDVFHFGEQLNYVEKLIDIIKKKTKTLCKKMIGSVKVRRHNRKGS